MAAILNLIMFLKLSCGLRYLHNYGTLDGTLWFNDDHMFKVLVATRNKFNMADAAILDFVLGIIQSPVMIFTKCNLQKTDIHR